MVLDKSRNRSVSIHIEEEESDIILLESEEEEEDILILSTDDESSEEEMSIINLDDDDSGDDNPLYLQRLQREKEPPVNKRWNPKSTNYRYATDEVTDFPFGRIYDNWFLIPFDPIPGAEKISAVVPMASEGYFASKQLKSNPCVYLKDFGYPALYGRYQIKSPTKSLLLDYGFLRDRVKFYRIWLNIQRERERDGEATNVNLCHIAKALDCVIDHFFSKKEMKLHKKIMSKIKEEEELKQTTNVKNKKKKAQNEENEEVPTSGKRVAKNAIDLRTVLPGAEPVRVEKEIERVPFKIEDGTLVRGKDGLYTRFVTDECIYSLPNKLPGTLTGFIPSVRKVDVPEEKQHLYQSFGCRKTILYPRSYQERKVCPAEKQDLRALQKAFPEIKDCWNVRDTLFRLRYAVLQAHGSMFNRQIFSIEDVDLESVAKYIRGNEDPPQIYLCYSHPHRKSMTTVEMRKAYDLYCRKIAKPMVEEQGFRKAYDEETYLRRNIFLMLHPESSIEKIINAERAKGDRKLEKAENVDFDTPDMRKTRRRYPLVEAGPGFEGMTEAEIINYITKATGEVTIYRKDGEILVVGEDKPKEVKVKKNPLKDRTRDATSKAWLPNNLTIVADIAHGYKDEVVTFSDEKARLGYRSYMTKSCYPKVCAALIADGWIHPMDRGVVRDDGVVYTSEYDIYIAFHGDYDMAVPPIHLLAVFGNMRDIWRYHSPKMDIDIYRPKTDKVSELPAWAPVTARITERRKGILMRYAVNCILHKLEYLYQVSNTILGDVYHFNRLNMDYVNLDPIANFSAVTPWIVPGVDNMRFMYLHTMWVASDDDLLAGKFTVDHRILAQDPVEELVSNGYIPARFRNKIGDGDRIYSNVCEVLIEFFGSIKTKPRNVFRPEDFGLDRVTGNKYYIFGQNHALRADPVERRRIYRELYMNLASTRTFMNRIMVCTEKTCMELAEAAGVLSELRRILDRELQNMRQMDELRLHYLKEGRSLLQEAVTHNGDRWHPRRFLSEWTGEKHFEPYEALSRFIEIRNEMMDKLGIVDSSTFSGEINESDRRKIKITTKPFVHRFKMNKQERKYNLALMIGREKVYAQMRQHPDQISEEQRELLSTELSPESEYENLFGMPAADVNAMVTEFLEYVKKKNDEPVEFVICDRLIYDLLAVMQTERFYNKLRDERNKKLQEFTLQMKHEVSDVSLIPQALRRGSKLPKNKLARYIKPDTEKPEWIPGDDNYEPNNHWQELYYRNWFLKINSKLQTVIPKTENLSCVISEIDIAYRPTEKVFLPTTFWKGAMATPKGKQDKLDIHVVRSVSESNFLYVNPGRGCIVVASDAVIQRLNPACIEPINIYKNKTAYGEFDSTPSDESPYFMLHNGKWILVPPLGKDKLKVRSIVTRERKTFDSLYIDFDGDEFEIDNPRDSLSDIEISDEEEEIIDDVILDEKEEASGYYPILLRSKEVAASIEAASMEVPDCEIETVHQALTREKAIERSQNIGVKIIYDNWSTMIGNDGEFGSFPALYRVDDNSISQTFESGTDDIVCWNGNCLGSYRKKDMKISTLKYKPLDIVNIELPIARDGRIYTYHIRCMLEKTNTVQACIVDELAAVFGLQKVGTHYIRVGTKIWVLYRLHNEIPVSLKDVNRDTIERIPEDLYQEVREVIAFKEAMRCHDIKQSTIIMVGGRPASVCNDGMIDGGGIHSKPEAHAMTRKKWFSEYETAAPIYRKFFRRVGSQMKIETIARSIMERIDAEFPMNYKLFARDIVRSMEQKQYDIPGIDKIDAGTIVTEKKNGKWNRYEFDVGTVFSLRKPERIYTAYVPPKHAPNTSLTLTKEMEARNRGGKILANWAAPRKVPGKLTEEQKKQRRDKREANKARWANQVVEPAESELAAMEEKLRAGDLRDINFHEMKKRLGTKETMKLINAAQDPCLKALDEEEEKLESKPLSLQTIDWYPEECKVQDILDKCAREKREPNDVEAAEMLRLRNIVQDKIQREEIAKKAEKVQKIDRIRKKSKSERTKEEAELLDQEESTLLQRHVIQFSKIIEKIETKYQKDAQIHTDLMIGLYKPTFHFIDFCDNVAPMGLREMTALRVPMSGVYPNLVRSDVPDELDFSDSDFDERFFEKIHPTIVELVTDNDPRLPFFELFEKFRHFAYKAPSADYVLYMGLDYLKSNTIYELIEANNGTSETSVNLIPEPEHPKWKAKGTMIQNFEDLLYHEVLTVICELERIEHNICLRGVAPDVDASHLAGTVAQKPRDDEMNAGIFRDMAMKAKGFFKSIPDYVNSPYMVEDENSESKPSIHVRYLSFWMACMYTQLYMERFTERTEQNYAYSLEPEQVNFFYKKVTDFKLRMNMVSHGGWMDVPKIGEDGEPEEEIVMFKKINADMFVDEKAAYCYKYLERLPKIAEKTWKEKMIALLGYDWFEMSEHYKSTRPLEGEIWRASKEKHEKDFEAHYPELKMFDPTSEPVTHRLIRDKEKKMRRRLHTAGSEPMSVHKVKQTRVTIDFSKEDCGYEFEEEAVAMELPVPDWEAVEERCKREAAERKASRKPARDMRRLILCTANPITDEIKKKYDIKETMEEIWAREKREKLERENGETTETISVANNGKSETSRTVSIANNENLVSEEVLDSVLGFVGITAENYSGDVDMKIMDEIREGMAATTRDGNQGMAATAATSSCRVGDYYPDGSRKPSCELVM